MRTRIAVELRRLWKTALAENESSMRGMESLRLIDVWCEQQ